MRRLRRKRTDNKQDKKRTDKEDKKQSDHKKQNDHLQPERKLLRRKNAAVVLDCSVTMVKRLEQAGRLTPIRLGERNVFYRQEQVEALARGE